MCFMTYYILVLITIVNYSAKSDIISLDLTQSDCFEQREYLVDMYSMPRAGIQAICIRMDH